MSALVFSYPLVFGRHRILAFLNRGIGEAYDEKPNIVSI